MLAPPARGNFHAKQDERSTERLRGRKLFCWGTTTGGRHWQEWLPGPDRAYLEIQAGLARTQLEHLPMPARSSWSWIGGYGLLAVDPQTVHGSWDQARAGAGAASAQSPAAAGALLEANARDWHALYHLGLLRLADGEDEAADLLVRAHDRIRELLAEGIRADDMRAGELSLDALWLAVHPGQPIPPAYDFRMSEG
ncbi:hypothetical protein [Streptacidiphilus sp. P02-A3a]|uniref:hypothetical protein n=1 Tax=Streptacidiphilus sp. P02-A3a TaxID=2704468 RepID=UPI0015FB1356|nr:hypothetical protein [Streptacidiphilus sp. P02-A3a]QMU71431.1 hypothetical protein GXP74_27560 [Streptacidiphilus sp. P02-A3a]